MSIISSIYTSYSDIILIYFSSIRVGHLIYVYNLFNISILLGYNPNLLQLNQGGLLDIYLQSLQYIHPTRIHFSSISLVLMLGKYLLNSNAKKPDKNELVD